MPKKGWRKPIVGDVDDPDGLVAWTQRYVEELKVKGYSVHSVKNTRGCLLLFVEWAFHRDVHRPDQVTADLLARHQRALFYRRKSNGTALTLSSQRQRLQKVRGFFRWLTRRGVIASDPAAELQLPRQERRLPTSVLSAREVERVLALADVEKPLGIRDRTIMEVLYSTGIRRTELCRLRIADIDAERGTVVVREGKGRKDRVVPIGARALDWVDRYLTEVRPNLVGVPGHATLFVNHAGVPLPPARLTQLMRRYLARADLGKSGACHIFRHTMATLMLEGGADVRLIQEILGHAELSTTEIYTRVDITHLKAVHARTHPGATAGPARRGPEAE